MFKKMKLYSKKEMEVLTFLARRPLAKMYSREVSRALKASVGGTNQILKKLAKESKLKVERRGRMLFYSINMDNPEVRELKVYLNISELMPLIEKIRKYSQKIILYGSCADGTDTEESDIDLFVLTDEKALVRDIIKKFKSSREILPVIVDNKEFIKMKQKDRAFYEQLMAGKELWSD